MGKFLSKLTNFLVWARVVDKHDGTVSLSPAVLAATTTAALARPSWPSVVALAVAGLLYAHKRYTSRAQSLQDKNLATVAEAMAKLSSDLSEVRREHRALSDKVVMEANRKAVGGR
jgi:asparagine N-glycosylation enzyme membrane subunit Stt3